MVTLTQTPTTTDTPGDLYFGPEDLIDLMKEWYGSDLNPTPTFVYMLLNRSRDWYSRTSTNSTATPTYSATPTSLSTPTPSATFGGGPKIVIDLDRSSTGIQSIITRNPEENFVQGRIVVFANVTNTVEAWAVEMYVQGADNTPSIIPNLSSVINGEILPLYESYPIIESNRIAASLFGTKGVPVGTDNTIVLLDFDMALNLVGGNPVDLTLSTSVDNPGVGVSINGLASAIGENLPGEGAFPGPVLDIEDAVIRVIPHTNRN